MKKKTTDTLSRVNAKLAPETKKARQKMAGDAMEQYTLIKENEEARELLTLLDSGDFSDFMSMKPISGVALLSVVCRIDAKQIEHIRHRFNGGRRKGAKAATTQYIEQLLEENPNQTAERLYKAAIKDVSPDSPFFADDGTLVVRQTDKNFPLKTFQNVISKIKNPALP